MTKYIFLILALLASGIACVKHKPCAMPKANEIEPIAWVYHDGEPFPRPVYPDPPGITYKYLGSIESYLSIYPSAFSYNKKSGSSYTHNILLVYQDSPSVDYNLWIVRAAWMDAGTVEKDEGLVIDVQMVPCHTMYTYFEAFYNKILKSENVLRTVRFVKSGELSELGFLERNFIESLPLAIKYKEHTAMLGSILSLNFRITPTMGGSGSILGRFHTDIDEFRELNPGYTKLYKDFSRAIPLVFVKWLIEDGHKISRKTRKTIEEFNLTYNPKPE